MTRNKARKVFDKPPDAIFESETHIHRTLPHSIEAEQGVLGSMLISPKEIIAECVEKINENYFYVPAHQTIYISLVELWTAGQAIDLLTFTQFLRDKNLLETVGGAAAITFLFTFVPTAANVTYYLEIVRDKYLLREIIATCTEGVRRSFEEQSDVSGLLGEVELKIDALAKDGYNRDRRKSLAEHVADKIARMEDGEPDADILFTKITELDSRSPLRRGDMPLITGERKDGKSILALSVLENICISQKRPGIIFSLEDRTPKVMDRIFAGVSRIPSNRHHVKKMSPQEIEASTKAAEKIGQADIIIYDDAFELSKIVSAFKQEFNRHNDLAVAIVDYAQLVMVPHRKGGTRQEEVALVSRTFRMLAMETGVPIILLSQLNAQQETRESKALEQDATANWRIKQVKGEARLRRIEIPWQRNGESGVSFEVGFFGEIARVENVSREPDLVFDKKRA